LLVLPKLWNEGELGVKQIKDILVHLKLEVDNPNDSIKSDHYICEDLKRELNCCTNYYEVEEIEISTASY